MAMVQGTAAAETLQGTSASDTITSGGGADLIQSGDGDDQIIASSPYASLTIDGGAGFDTLSIPYDPANFGSLLLSASTLTSLERLDFQSPAGMLLHAYLTLNPANQVTASGLEALNGGAGQDILTLYVGQSGSYTVPHFTLTNWTTTSLAANSDIVAVEVRGQDFTGAVTLHVSDDGSASHAGVESLKGSAGNDTLLGNDGIDILDGGGGVDVLHAGAGNDMLVANGNVSVGGGGTTFLSQAPSIYDGGSGFDYLAVPVSSTLQVFDQTASFISIEGIYFQRPNPAFPPQFVPTESLTIASTAAKTLPSDLLLDGKGDFQISMDAGDSFDASAYRFAPGSHVQFSISANRAGGGQIVGTANADRIYGSFGHDNLFGGDGSDTLTGEDGNDHLYGRSSTGGPDGADEISGDGGTDYIQGNAGNDTLDGGDGPDRINGGADNDVITGGEGADTVNGNLGNDTIAGEVGNDSLRGGQGNDSISGNDGDDTLSGDLGSDTLTGGTGRDSFSFLGQASIAAAPDMITDFDPQQDRLMIGFAPAAILSGSAASPPSLAAAAAQAQQLSDGHAGDHEVAAIAVGNDTYVFYASNAGAIVDSAILLQGVSAGAITTQDFG